MFEGGAVEGAEAGLQLVESVFVGDEVDLGEDAGEFDGEVGDLGVGEGVEVLLQACGGLLLA